MAKKARLPRFRSRRRIPRPVVPKADDRAEAKAAEVVKVVEAVAVEPAAAVEWPR